MDVAVQFQLNGGDGLQTLRLHKPSFMTNVAISILAPAALVAFGVLCLALPGSQTLAWVSVGVGAALLLVVTTQWAYLVHQLRRTWNQVEPLHLVARDAGLTVTERGAQSEVAWSRYLRFREGSHHFLLYKSADLYSVVPKRAFANQDEMDHFRDILRRAIPNG